MSRWDKNAKCNDVNDSFFKYTMVMGLSFVAGMAVVLLFGSN